MTSKEQTSYGNSHGSECGNVVVLGCARICGWIPKFSLHASLNFSWYVSVPQHFFFFLLTAQPNLTMVPEGTPQNLALTKEGTKQYVATKT
jgi:hypothetical protein